MYSAAKKFTTDKPLEEMKQLFPDMLPDTSTMFKKWIWKEETNSLEQITTGRQLTNASRAKKMTRPLIAPHKSSSPIKQKKAVRQHKKSVVTSPKPSTVKIHTSETRSITLHDVKVVSYELLVASNDVAELFQDSVRENQFDALLVVLLCYFDVFFDRIALENQSKSTLMEPSVAEKKAILVTINKQERIKKQLAKKYCTLLLGLQGEKQHHMACGRQRKSFTKTDRAFYETLYSFCCLVVWVTFRRNSLELIQEELGRLFRSNAFNAHGRPVNNDGFKLASDLTTEDIHNIKLASFSSKQNKRPPIKSMINQRSPVLVALLPNSKESATWLLDRSKPFSIKNSKAGSKQNDNIYEINVESMRVGIIGEMISGFNPFTLAPFEGDEDNEEEENIEDGNVKRSMEVVSDNSAQASGGKEM